MGFQSMANLLSRITGEEKYFLDNGFPPIATRMENVLYTHPEDYYVFSPEYQVITQLRKEGNIYITIENITKISFRFYGEKYPRSYYYKVNTELSGVVRCENSKNCKEMEDCHTATIPHNNPEELSNRTIFLSWKMKIGYIVILWQYRNKLIKCEDFNALNVIKLILEGKQQQEFNSKIDNFARYLNKSIANEVISMGNINLPTVVVQFTHCAECNMTLFLNCNYHSDIAYSSKVPDINFGNFKALGWNEIFLRTTVDDNTCSLTISTMFFGEWKTHQFWAFAAVYFTNYITPTTVTTTPATTTTTKTTETINNTTVSITTTTMATTTTAKLHPKGDTNCNSANGAGAWIIWILILIMTAVTVIILLYEKISVMCSKRYSPVPHDEGRQELREFQSNL